MSSVSVKKSKHVDIESIREAFYIDGNSVCWKEDRCGGRFKAGSVAGYPNKAGYYDISFMGVRYYAHRIAFALHHNRWPEGVVDHVDSDPGNNCPSNLREASDSQNNFNAKIRITNITGVIGVSAHGYGGWSAEIRAFNKRHRKWFKTFEEAVEWRAAKEIELHGAFSPKQGA